MHQDLNERVTRLERENLRLKCCGGIALILLGGVSLLGLDAPQKVPDLVQAHAFQVVNKAGKICADLSERSRAVVIEIEHTTGKKQIYLINAMDVTSRYSYADAHAEDHCRGRLKLAGTDKEPALEFDDDSKSVMLIGQP